MSAIATPVSPTDQPTNQPATGPTTGPVTRSRGWAWAGVAAGVTGVTGIVASGMADAVYDPDSAGDAHALVAGLAGQVPQLLVFHVATMVTVALLPVVAAGLHRRLRDATPADSLLGPVAAVGLVLVAVAGLLGTALDTEFVFGLTEPGAMVPETAVLYGHWVATVPWLWVGAGLAGLAVAGAAFRYRAVPRWLGIVGAVLGGLTLLLGISPLQYMAGMVGPVWLLVTMLGFALGDRSHGR